MSEEYQPEKRARKVYEKRVDAKKLQLAFIKCGHCMTELSGYHSFYLHTRRQHDGMENAKIARVRQAKNPLHCDKCTFVTASAVGMARHTNTKHGEPVVRGEPVVYGGEIAAVPVEHNDKIAGAQVLASLSDDEGSRKRKLDETSESVSEPQIVVDEQPKKVARQPGTEDDEYCAHQNKLAERLAQWSARPAAKVREWQATLAALDVYTLTDLHLLGREALEKLPVSQLLIKCLIATLEH